MSPRLTFVGIAATAAAALAILFLYSAGFWQRVSSPGPLSSGHADLACSECHTGWNTGAARMNGRCLDCHRDDVGAARNAHSPAYFRIVGAKRGPWYLSPTDCSACHHGHQRAGDASNPLSAMPHDFCAACHRNVQARVSGPDFVVDHRGLSFASCQSCHAFHRRTLFKPELD